MVYRCCIVPQGPEGEGGARTGGEDGCNRVSLGGVSGPGGSAETSVGCPGIIWEKMKISILGQNFHAKSRFPLRRPRLALRGWRASRSSQQPSCALAEA